MPKILAWRRVGKIGHSRHKLGIPRVSLIQYSSIAQSVEHLTVNQGVTGSSPVGGAKKAEAPQSRCFLLFWFLDLIWGVAIPWRACELQGDVFRRKTRTVGARQLYVTWFESSWGSQKREIRNYCQSAMVSDFLLFSQKILFSVTCHDGPLLVASCKITTEYPFCNCDAKTKTKGYLLWKTKLNT